MRPITIVWNEVAIGLLFGTITTLAVLPLGGAIIGRKRGLLLLTLYIVYLVMILLPFGRQ